MRLKWYQENDTIHSDCNIGDQPSAILISLTLSLWHLRKFVKANRIAMDSLLFLQDLMDQ